MGHRCLVVAIAHRQSAIPGSCRRRRYAEGAVIAAIPIAWYPLSTYTVFPVMPLAIGEHRNAAARPTSSAVNFSVIGAFAETYSTIFSMMPIALAARDASGPA